jgi:dTDP-4-amino-4,6-dideoxygalactose transaminase
MLNENLIPFHRPMKLFSEETEQIKNKIDSCLNSGILTNKENVRELEERIKELHKVDYAIATSSGTQALVIALQSLVNIEDKIPFEAYTQAFTWYSTPYSIQTCGRLPIYCDIDPDTWTMKEECNYKLAVPVHTFGNVSSIESTFKVYDGAHCLGAKLEDIGDATILSLASTKLITSIEGGVILTNDSKLAKYATDLRDKVSRMSEIHAIFGNAYLNYIEEISMWKKEVYNYYRKHLDGIFQKTADSSNHNTIGMLTSLKIPSHIETRKYYQPLHSHVQSGELPNTDAIYRSIVCLPSWYGCPYKQIVDDINNFNKGDGL